MTSSASDGDLGYPRGVVFRTPDEERVAELERARRAEAELDAVASAGRRRRAQMEAAEHARAEAARAPDASRLRWRMSPYGAPGASAAPPWPYMRGVAVFAVLTGAAAAAAAPSMVGGFIGGGFGGLMLGWTSGFVGVPILARRAVARERAWLAVQPFPVSGYLDLLAQPRSLAETRILAEIPTISEQDEERLRDLLGHVRAGAATRVVMRSDGATFVISSLGDDDARDWLHQIVDLVLRPLHAVRPIVGVRITGDLRDD